MNVFEAVADSLVTIGIELVLRRLTDIVHRMDQEVRCHTLCLLTRLLLDRGIVNDSTALTKIEDLTSVIIDGMNEDSLDEEVSGFPCVFQALS